jgi:thiol-disulfide isomerase/thioredoxin
MRTVLSLLAILLSVGLSVASAQQPITVRGAVVGHDGQAMRAGIARLNGSGSDSQKQPLDPQGQFSFTVSSPGSYTLIVAGVHHRTLFFPVFIEEPGTIEVRVRLAASEYRTELTELRVIGDFNKFSTDTGGVAMERQADGSFAATVAWKAEKLAYQVQGVLDGTDPICGTQAESFEQDKNWPFIDNGNNQFVSVIKTSGERVRIVFDPRQLPHSTSAPEVRFSDTTGTTAWVAATDREFTLENRRISAARDAYVRAGNPPTTFKADVTEWLRQLDQRIQDERDPLRRQYLMLRYFAYPGAQTNVQLAKRALDETPPESLAWSMLWGGPQNTFSNIARVAQSASEDRYIAAAFGSNPVKDVRAAFLHLALMKAFQKKDANAVARLYTQLMGDYGDTSYARRAADMAPSRNIQTGKAVPDFAFVSLDDASRTVTPKAMRGRTYLIDFWAVWCGPCVAEMEHLHAAYAKFKDKGFEIVSVSFDDKASTVAEFRKSKWPMPWFNALLSGFDSDTATAFEVVGVPKPVLVGPDGRIIATEGDLHGARLLDTLAKVFGTTPTQR